MSSCTSLALPPPATAPRHPGPTGFRCTYRPTPEMGLPSECPGAICNKPGTFIPSPLDAYMVEEFDQCLAHARMLELQLVDVQKDYVKSYETERKRSDALAELAKEKLPWWVWSLAGTAAGATAATLIFLNADGNR